MKTPIRKTKLIVVFTSIVLLSNYNAYCQYDTTHYFPPFYARSSSSLDLGQSYMYLSTNDTTSFDVTVKKSDGTIVQVATISKNQPAQIYLGAQYNTHGILDSTGLNQIITDEALIAKANKHFFANIRHISGTQGMSITSKGAWAKGTRFRSGHLYTTQSASVDDSLKSHMISVMALHDNTTITFSDFKNGVIFHGTSVTGNTSDDISITLNENESYIIATHMDEPFATGNDTLVNGVLITSNNPIVVNTGSWCGGSNNILNKPSRDIGMDQIVPVSLIGTQHIVSKRFSIEEEQCERVIIVADEDNTFVSFNGFGGSVQSLSAGEFFVAPPSFYDANDIMFIESSKPVYVYQSTNGSNTVAHAQGLNFIPSLNCDGISEVVIPFLDCFGNEPANIDIIAKLGSSVMLNGVQITSNPFPVTGNPNYVVYKLSNIAGHAHISSSEDIKVAILANKTDRGAAGYYSGFGKPYTGGIRSFSKNNESQIIEGCSQGMFILSKPKDKLNVEHTVLLEFLGSAENGKDYSYIPSVLTIPAGVSGDTITVSAIEDALNEDDEVIILRMRPTECEASFSQDSLIIINYADMVVKEISEDQVICPDLGESVNLNVAVTGGIQPYNYYWVEEDVSAQTLSVSPSTNAIYTVEIEDRCGKVLHPEPIKVEMVCMPLIPNVITPNGDGINDFFEIENLEQHASSQLIVLNRWGGVVYQSEGYNNDWNGDGLNEGTYFYTLEFGTHNAEFSDQRKSVLTGHVTIIR